MKVCFAILMVLAVAGVAAADVRPDIVLGDFEGQDYGTWQAIGDAFGKAPAQGTLPHQMDVSGFAGHGLVNSFTGGDHSTGTLTSAAFVIDRDYVSFLIGGGGFPGRTCMNLLVDGKLVRAEVGPNVNPGGSEELEPSSWDVREFAGQKACIEIIDAASGGWGHINVDQIVLTDRKPPAARVPWQKEFVVEKRYLLLPVHSGDKKSPKQRVGIDVDGKTVRDFDIELTDKPDWFAHLDASAWRGKNLLIRIDKIAADSPAMDLIKQSDTIWSAETCYREPLRPQFHFSPRRGWNNDPNGMVFADGEYHLYFQHNPYGWSWGNMHWGHSVSRDLVHWEELPVAIYPREHGDWVFSGSGVVDRENSSGWKSGTNALIVVAFTSTGRGECIAYSNDRGRSFTEFEGNPVVKHAGRDPRLFWHAASRQWVMAVYDEFEGGRYIAFYSSPDLKKWTFRSRIAGFYECPDIFELPLIGGKSGDRRWVLTAANSDYMVGQFDGATFKADTEKIKGHNGEAFYAAQTFSDVPDGRRIQIGWGQAATPGMPFNQLMMFPCELTLKTTEIGPRLSWKPVKEIERLYAEMKSQQTVQNPDLGLHKIATFHTGLCDVKLDMLFDAKSEVDFDLAGTHVAIDPGKNELTWKKTNLHLPIQDGRVSIRVLIDRTTVELFADDGRIYVPMKRELDHVSDTISVTVKGSPLKSISSDVHELKSAWLGD